MNTQQLARRHTLVALALQAWEQEGYALTPGAMLQVQQLLAGLPPDAPDAQLRNALTALLARNEAEQVRLHTLFDRCARQAGLLCADPLDARPAVDEAVEAAQAGERRWRYRFVPPAALLLALLAWGLWQYLRPELPVGEPRGPRTEAAQARPGDTLRQALHRDTARLLRAEPSALTQTSAGNTFYIDITGTAFYLAAPESPASGEDTARFYLHYADGTDSVKWLIALAEPDTLPEPPPVDSTGTLRPQVLPYPADITPLLLDAKRVQRYEWFRRYEWPLKALLLLLAGALAWALLRWQQYRRARVVAELRQSRNAPYLWQPAAGTDTGEWAKDAAQPLLNRLRGRAPDDFLRLDLPATVAATIRRAGQVSFQYRRRTLPPAYLLLIDRQGADDHRARLFDAFYQAMLAAEVPVSRYYYHGDPRLCFNEAHPYGIALVELQHRYADTRLLLVGNGQGLLSVATGRMASWAGLLEAWGQRALLSTRARSEWGLPEQELAKLLLLLPATEQGLGLALEAFLAEEQPTQQQLMEALGGPPEPGIRFRGELLQELGARYDQPALDWIAACAVWPTLHWDLTLHLGQCIAEHHGQALLSFERLRRLGMLPWFAQGKMPERARLLLLEYLQERGLEAKVRQALRELLAQSAPPPPDAVAYGDYRMNLILNELLLKPDPATRRRLEAEFANWMAAGKEPDFVALRLLDRPATRLDVLVGKRLKKFAFREGLPGLGWKRLPKLLAIWAALATALLLLRPSLDPCAGGTATHQGQALCLADAQDSLLLWRILAAEAVQVQDTAAIDSLQALADGLVPTRDTAFYLNTAAHHYNYGLAYLQDTAQSACRNFARAQALAERLAPGGEPLYRLALQQHCQMGDAVSPADTATFTLSGRILDAETGQPIPGVSLRAAPAGRITDAQLRQGTAEGIRSATADGQGRYRLPDLPLSAQWQLYAAAEGYEPGLRRTAPTAQAVDIRLQLDAAARERAAWARATAANTPEAYSQYLADFPEGPNTAEARRRQADGLSARERADWEEAQRANTIAAYERYKGKYASGAFLPEANARIAALQAKAAADAAIAANTIAAYEAFLAGPHRESEQAPDIRRRRDALQEAADFQAARTADTRQAYDAYLAKWANGANATEARRLREAVVPPPTSPIAQLEADMVRVAGGSFTMGCESAERDGECYDFEKPPRTVRVPAFSIGKYEVTQAQWRAVMGSDPPELNNKGCDDCPVERVSWNDIQEFLRKLNELTGKRYRLPTEAEWEYAARGGAQSRGFLYSGSNNIDEVAWYGSNARSGNTHGAEKTTRPVGQKEANELGLYDMSGNVYEWCEDDWHDNYNGAPTDGRAWVDSPRASSRVSRGGGWFYPPQYCRAADRGNRMPANRDYDVGFRLAL